MVGSGTTSKAATDGKDQFERLLQLTQEIASLARVKKGLDLKISDHYDRVKRRVIVEILTINSQHHAGSDYRLTRVVVKLPRHMMSYPMERVARELLRPTWKQGTRASSFCVRGRSKKSFGGIGLSWTISCKPERVFCREVLSHRRSNGPEGT